MQGSVGALTLCRTHLFTDNEVQLVTTIGDIAASTLRRTTLRNALQQSVDDLQDRNQDLNRLYKSSMALLAQPGDSMETLYQTIVETVREEFQHRNCSLFLIDNGSPFVRRAAATGDYADRVRDQHPGEARDGSVIRAIREGQGSNIGHLQPSERSQAGWSQANAQLVVSLRSGNRIIGALELMSTEVDAFGAEDERALELFGERAALTLDNARLYAQTESRLKQLDTLRNIDIAISTSMDLSITMNILIDQLMRQLNVDAAAVHLLDPYTQQLEFQQGRGFRSSAIEGPALRLGQGHASSICATVRLKATANVSLSLQSPWHEFSMWQMKNWSIFGVVPCCMISVKWPSLTVSCSRKAS